jgi:hypothetical protein
MFISDRYLVTMKDTLPPLEQYLKAISKQNEAHWSNCTILEYTFRQLEAVFVKAFSETTSHFDVHHIHIDVTVVLHEPVNMNVLLKVATTSNLSAGTTFFGANLLPAAERHGPRFYERISQLILEGSSYILRSPTPVVFPTDSKAVHVHDPDFHLSLHSARRIDDSPVWLRHMMKTKETFDAFLSAIPARKEGSDLCQLKINCLMTEFGILYGAVSVTRVLGSLVIHAITSRFFVLFETMPKSR